VCAYNNLLKYEYDINNNFINVKQRRKNTFLLLKYDLFPVSTSIYSEQTFPVVKKKVKEVVYDLYSIFTKPSKEVRRGISLDERLDVKIENYQPLNDFTKTYELYEEWVTYKNADPAVFRMTFSPTRYANTLYLKNKLPNIYHKNIYIKGELYATIVFHLNPETHIAYELAFISKFWDTNLKLINDLNFCILIWCFHDLYAYCDMRKVNVGTDAGIKGLKLFKNKIPHEYNLVYST